MKTFVKNAALSMVAVSAVLLTGCSKKGEEAVVVPDNGERVLIQPTAQMPVYGSIDVASRAVVDKGHATIKEIAFARIDQAEADGSYPAYSTVDSAFIAKWVGTLSDDFASPTAVSFYDPKFYLTRVNNNNTKLVGWYPAEALSSGDVSIAVNGENDILLSNEIEANKTTRFGAYDTSKSINNIFNFEHQLTQLKVQAYADTADAKTVWGKVKSIKLKGQNPTCKITLPATVTFEGTAADLALVEKVAATDAAIDYATNSGLELGVAAKDGSGNVTATNAVECGYAMVEPIADGGSLTLIVETEKGGSREIGVELFSQTVESATVKGFLAGRSYNIVLKFTAVTIEPKAVITAWIPAADDIEIEL